MNTDLTRHRTFFRVLFAVWLAGVIWGSLINGNEMLSIEKTLPLLGSKMLRHFSAYTGLAFLSILAFERRHGVVLALSMILLGVAIELAQQFSPGRTPAIADAVVNAVGVLVGIASGVLLATAAARLRAQQTIPSEPRP